MKQKYRKPEMEVLELYVQKALLLPASPKGSTDEVLAPRFDNKNRQNDELDEEEEEEDY
ncbi:MAG: hypothetical protein IJP46_03085 [Prevotella sp.]|nr:hypothetical protein [Prevotella sp.]